ncbi:AdoMet-dependent rRNA methyltransferase spb1 [Phlyctochytrium bullatum]|nr:AdoMet-dependent rRNA methyltransferase spb1 [Phlyctochytrium bullatum]
MGITKKHAKGRLDKYYHMAKEQGYRARSAFKLIQLNKKYSFLEKSKVCIDLCAAPGGWLQVAAKYMPKPSIIVGVDLAPIKPIPGVITHVEDITTSKCRATIRGELKTWKADVVLHDGAPNVGVSWVQDAFTQSELTLSALKLATEFLVPGGTFVTKVFRSKDYNKLMWVFNQLFKSVEATKPASSRSVSAEIFVVCRDFLAPKKIDSKLLDPKFVFTDVEDSFEDMDEKKKKELQGAVLNDLLHPEKKRRHREGYADGATVLHVTTPVSDFIRQPDFVNFLARSNQLVFTNSEDDQNFKKHKLTAESILEYCEDLRVLGRREFKELIKWRDSIREAFGLNPRKEEKEEEEKEPEKPKTAEEERLDLAEELSKQAAGMEAQLKREKRKARERKAKQLLRMRLGMETPTDIGLDVDGGMLEEIGVEEQEENDEVDINSISRLIVQKRKEQRLKGDAEEVEAEEEENDDEDDDEVKVKRIEQQLNEQMQQYEERKATRDPKAAKKKEKKQGAKDFEEWYGVEWEQKQLNGVKRKRDDELEEASDDDSEDSDSDGPEEATETAKSSLSRRAKQFFQNPLFSNIHDERNGGLFAKEIDSKDMAESESDEDDYKPRKKAKKSKNDDDEDDKGGFEIAPLDPADKKQLQDDFVIDTAAKYTMAQNLLQKSTRGDTIDDAYNRYAWNDPEGVPSWFLDDEQRHSQRNLPITKEAVQIMKARLRALDARPIKKVAEAQFRKKMRAENKIKKALKKASEIADDEDISEKQKLKDASKVMAKALIKKSKKPTLVVAKNMNRGLKGRPKGVKGRYKSQQSYISEAAKPLSKWQAKLHEEALKCPLRLIGHGEKPANIVDHISVKELNMGTKPPELEILEIGELAEERFRGIFKLVYSGDAYVVLQTKVQTGFGNPMLAANLPLVVPMRLRISNLKLRGIIVLVVDKVRGITLVFKNDPLEKVDVNSTFDNIPSIRRFLQNQIEGQLRKMFQDDLPLLIHNLSLEFIQKKEDEKTPVGTVPYRESDAQAGEPYDPEKENFMINRPHMQKWIGNEYFDFGDGYSSDGDAQNYGYVLYRSLIPPEKTPIGLHTLSPEAIEDSLKLRSVLRAKVHCVLRLNQHDGVITKGPVRILERNVLVDVSTHGLDRMVDIMHHR